MFDLENFHSQLLWLNFRGYIWACCCPKCQDRGSGCVWEGFLSVETLLYRYRVILSALFKPYWKLHFKIIIIIQVLLIKRVLYSSCWTRPMGGFDCLCGLLLSSSLFSLWKNQKCSNIIGHDAYNITYVFWWLVQRTHLHPNSVKTGCYFCFELDGQLPILLGRDVFKKKSQKKLGAWHPI